MKPVKYFTTGLILFSCLRAYPQASLDTLLARVLSKNPEIIGAKQYLENTRITSRTNLYPENPEVEYAHLWGNPSGNGIRNDFSVTQKFDFPGVYINRSRHSGAVIDKAASLERSVRQETLLLAKHLWIEKVYLNKCRFLLEQRMKEARQVIHLMQKQYEAGEISRLRFNKAVLLEGRLKAEESLLGARVSAINAAIEKTSGSTGEWITDTQYYPADFTLLDSVLEASLDDPGYQAHLKDIELMTINKQLARSSAWPKFMAGYFSEQVLGTGFRGVQLGLTIPLWENSNKVKAASGEIIFAEMAADRFRNDQVSEINQLYAHYQGHRKQVEELGHALEQGNDPALLVMAVESGEITTVEYFYELELYYEVQDALLAAERELFLAESGLTKYELYPSHN